MIRVGQFDQPEQSWGDQVDHIDVIILSWLDQIDLFDEIKSIESSLSKSGTQNQIEQINLIMLYLSNWVGQVYQIKLVTPSKLDKIE